MIRPHRTHEMQTLATDVSGVCPSVCLSLGGARAACAGSFGTAFVRLVSILYDMTTFMSNTRVICVI